MASDTIRDGAVGMISAKTPEYRYPQVPLDVDGYPIVPEGLKLEQVHVYVRHGVCVHKPYTTYVETHFCFM